MILIDTHVWIWLNSRPERLSASAFEKLRDAPQLCLSSISIYETMVAVDKGRIVSAFDPATQIRRWLDSRDIARIPVSDEVAIHSRSLKFLHEDPFDRIIAATAFHENVPLMTADRNLLRLDWLRTIPAQ